jgi:HSP20 family protein
VANDLIHLMQSLFVPVAERFREVSWRPATDVYQTRYGWLLKFDLAGVRPDDIRLEVSGRRLSVSGFRRDCFREEECCFYRMEIAYSHFERTIDLPCSLESARITTEYQYGMLLVRIQTEAEL